MKLPVPLPNVLNSLSGYCVLVAPHAAADALLEVTATLAADRPINILDAALRFDIHRVARLLRRDSTVTYAALERITLVRVFNACQLTDALRSFESDNDPVLIFGALALFETDLYSNQRELYLQHSYFAALQRMGRERLLITGVKPTERLTQAPWNQLLLDAARVYDLSDGKTEPQKVQQLEFFTGE